MFTRIVSAILLALLAYSALCSCSKNAPNASPEESVVEAQMKQNQAEMENFAQSYKEILGIHILTSDSYTYDSVINMNMITDDLHLTLISKTTNDFNCVMKLLFDYNEIQFTVNGTLVDSYEFSVKSSDSLEIQFNLPESLSFDEPHILTAVIMPNFDKHAYDGSSDGVPPLSKDFELVPSANADGAITANSAPELPDKFLSIQYQGIMLNSDFSAENAEGVDFPKRFIETAAGETVRVAYRAGNYDDSDDMLLIALLGGDPIHFNGKPYIHLKNEPCKIAYGVLEFPAPDIPGKYELFGFVTKSPYQHRHKENATYYDASIPFTIIAN
jgi:hypothetical protein